MQSDETLTAMEFAGLSSYESWMHYCNMGGFTDYFEFDAYLHGVYALDAGDADLVSQAVNELIDDVTPGEDALLCRAPYSWTPALRHLPGDAAESEDVDGPIQVPVDDLVGPHSPTTFGSRFLTGLDVSALAGRPGIPLPPGAPLELLGEILDSGVIGRIFSGRRN
ncbi:hypothetical protein ACX80U_07595 [Arthrobacter sp. TmT3-37]|uniref:Uncharacterized protein n=1 Tax=Arthrobacter agilis TaxID=37921 RepID=A0A2L0UHZ0_9MICC|nr:hypothetical protein [Arthrobacter agilis]AUZ88874.1 hypothetical protein CVO76_15405 [Arthrobacter agilis]